MRLIDASELQEEYKQWHDGKRLLLIDVAPTVDAVPVVRCKDCIRYRPDDDVWGQCTVMPYRMRKNDYCSYGVIDDMRKDGKDGDHEQTKKPE